MTALAGRLSRLEACVPPDRAVQERLQELIRALPTDLLRRLTEYARLDAEDIHTGEALTRELIAVDPQWSPILAAWKREQGWVTPHGG
jgi:hypothetical protein